MVCRNRTYPPLEPFDGERAIHRLLDQMMELAGFRTDVSPDRRKREILRVVEAINELVREHGLDWLLTRKIRNRAELMELFGVNVTTFLRQIDEFWGYGPFLPVARALTSGHVPLAIVNGAWHGPGVEAQSEIAHLNRAGRRRLALNVVALAMQRDDRVYLTPVSIVPFSPEAVWSETGTARESVRETLRMARLVGDCPAFAGRLAVPVVLRPVRCARYDPRDHEVSTMSPIRLLSDDDVRQTVVEAAEDLWLFVDDTPHGATASTCTSSPRNGRPVESDVTERQLYYRAGTAEMATVLSRDVEGGSETRHKTNLVGGGVNDQWITLCAKISDSWHEDGGLAEVNERLADAAAHNQIRYRSMDAAKKGMSLWTTVLAEAASA